MDLFFFDMVLGKFIFIVGELLYDWKCLKKRMKWKLGEKVN